MSSTSTINLRHTVVIPICAAGAYQRSIVRREGPINRAKPEGGGSMDTKRKSLTEPHPACGDLGRYGGLLMARLASPPLIAIRPGRHRTPAVARGLKDLEMLG